MSDKKLWKFINRTQELSRVCKYSGLVGNKASKVNYKVRLWKKDWWINLAR